MGSSGDSEKIIQRLTDELREAQELANTEKHKCLELQGGTAHLMLTNTICCVLCYIHMCTHTQHQINEVKVLI